DLAESRAEQSAELKGRTGGGDRLWGSPWFAPAIGCSDSRLRRQTKTSPNLCKSKQSGLLGA
ncbi:hypothetical protein LPJ54_005390, partial [Coemansia sp. RSA 1824]